MNHIYFICSHFTYLVLYHGMSCFFRRYYPDVKQSMVLVEYPFLSLVDYEEFVQGYDSNHRVTYGETAFTTTWRNEYRLGAIKGRLTKVRDSLKDARKFTFEEGSLCFISEMTEATPVVRLLIAKLRRETRDSVLCRVGTCFHRTDECKTNNWLSWLDNNLYVLLGAPPVAVKFYGWMMAERRFYSEHKVVDRHLVFSNRWSNNRDFLEVRYPLLDNGQASPSKRQYVLFLDHGTGWLSLFPEMSVEMYIDTTNSILRALTELYRDEDVDLLFKRHPRGHEDPYDLAGFEIYENNVTAEMIFHARGAGDEGSVLAGLHCRAHGQPVRDPRLHLRRALRHARGGAQQELEIPAGLQRRCKPTKSR